MHRLFPCFTTVSLWSTVLTTTRLPTIHTSSSPLLPRYSRTGNALPDGPAPSNLPTRYRLRAPDACCFSKLPLTVLWTPRCPNPRGHLNKFSCNLEMDPHSTVRKSLVFCTHPRAGPRCFVGA